MTLEMSHYNMRRATTDDLPQLVALWQAAQLPALELEKRFTEFQVAESAEGKLIAAIGLRIAQQQGHLHSETFADFSLADKVRVALWERIEKVALNHGLFRIWTQETAPFWKHVGFVATTKEILGKRPEVFGADSKAEWLMRQLREEVVAAINLDKEFENFKLHEQARSEQMQSQAKLIKGIATVIAILLAIYSVVTVFMYLRYTQTHSTRPPATRGPD